MAEGDNKYVPVVTPQQKQGQIPDLQALNEVIRQAFMNMHKMEGRSGEVTVRDDLRVMGKFTLEAKAEEPALSESDEAVIYLDEDGGAWISIDTGEWRPLIGSVDVTGIGVVDELTFRDDYFIVEGDSTAALVRPILYPIDYPQYTEEFVVGDGWSTDFTGTAGAGSVPIQDRRVGIRSIQTGATVSSTAALFVGATPTSGVVTLENITGWWLGAGAVEDTDIKFMVGMGSDLSDPDFGDEALFFVYDSSVDANWHVVGRTGGVSDDFDTGVPFVADTGIDFYIDVGYSDEADIIFWTDGDPIGSTSNIPVPTTPMNFGIRVENLAGANKSAWVDYSQFGSNVARSGPPL